MSIVASAQSIAADVRSLVEKVGADHDVSSPPILGQGTESSIRELLSRLLPARVGLASGMLTNEDGQASPQIDTIVYDVWHSGPLPTATPRYPCDAALGTIEIKRTLKRSDIDKASRDARVIKLMKKHRLDFGELPADGGAPLWRRAALPPIPHCSLFSVLSGLSLDSYARHWQRHYYDVPFGCSLDSVVLLDRGFIVLAAWHPRPGIARDAFTPVYGMHPGHADENGSAVLLFPRWSIRGRPRFTRISQGPRVPWAVGSALFLGVTECGFHALSAWIRMFLGFCAAQLAPSFVPEIGHLSEGLPEGTMTKFLPVAIAADPDILARDGTDYACKMAVELLRWS